MVIGTCFFFFFWFRAFEQLVESGKVRSIGVSNYTVAHLTELFEYCKIKPAVNQVEFHPKLYQQDLLKLCQDNDIVLEAYSSLAKGKVSDVISKAHKLKTPSL